MAPANILTFLQARERGHTRTRLRETQVKLLRLRERWSVPYVAPSGSDAVKDIVPLGDDAFCLVCVGGRADAFAVAPLGLMLGPEAAEQDPQWLTSLNVFHGERVRMVAHLGSGALLTVFAVSGHAYRGRLFARVLDVEGILSGETRTRSCGTLADVSVPAGGFIEFDDQNHCVWAHDCQRLRCWDTESFAERFALGPWELHEVPNVRFTRGFAGLLRPGRDGAIEVVLYDAKDGTLRTRTEVQMKPPELDFVFLEMVNDCVLMKRLSCEVVVLSLESNRTRVLPGTVDWEPDAFVFLPSRMLILALFADALEIWSCSSPEFCCRLGTVRQVAHITAHRFTVHEGMGAALVVRSPGAAAAPGGRARDGRRREELVLLDLLRFGGVRASLRGAWEAGEGGAAAGGGGGGGIARVLFDAARSLLLLLDRKGSLSAYSTG